MAVCWARVHPGARIRPTRLRWIPHLASEVCFRRFGKLPAAVDPESTAGLIRIARSSHVDVGPWRLHSHSVGIGRYRTARPLGGTVGPLLGLLSVGLPIEVGLWLLLWRFPLLDRVEHACNGQLA